MTPQAPGAVELVDPQAREFYVAALAALNAAGLPYLVGGAYAFARYTGIERHTKDLDLFVRRADAPAILAELAWVGYQGDMTFPHWLGKAFHGADARLVQGYMTPADIAHWTAAIEAQR